MPQQSLEPEQCWPACMQLPPEHTPVELQVRVPQHWDEEVQWPPTSKQLPSEHTPPLQVRVPQQSEEEAQWAPLPKQLPSEQILLELQLKVPQQSPEVPQWAPLSPQGPVAPGVVGGTSTPPMSQARGIRKGKVRTRTRKACSRGDRIG